MRLIDYNKIEKHVPIIGALLMIFGAFISIYLLIKNVNDQDWSQNVVGLFYNLPMLFVFFVWTKCKIQEKEIVYFSVFLIDFLVLGLVATRLFDLMYHSGHVLFLLYAFLTTSNKFFRFICLIMAVVTIYFKLIFWSDYITPIIGLVMALILVWLRNKSLTNIRSSY